MGSGSSTSSYTPPPISENDEIDTGDAIHAGKIRTSTDLTKPFSQEDNHSMRNFSQLNFNAKKQLEGYNSAVTSTTATVVNNVKNNGNGGNGIPTEDEMEPKLQCVKIDSATSQNPTSNHILKALVPVTNKHFFTYYEVPISKMQNLCQTPEKYSTYHIELDISGLDIQYGVADAIQILPENPPAEVDVLAQFFHLNLDDYYEFSNNLEDILIPFPSPFSVRQVLTCYLDFMGKPKKGVFEGLKKYVTDMKEKQWLDQILSGSSREFDALASSGTRYSQIFVKYLPTLQLTIDQIIAIFPIIKPRSYTCASSPLVHPNSIHLCAACHQYKLPTGEIWYGLCSAYLKRLSIGSTIKIIHKKNGFDLPSLTTPVILIGIGSGIAPLRSIIQHRAALAEQNNILNHYVKTILLYECNDPEEDFLYYDEICEANRNRSVTTCHVAFSHRTGAYRSIQHLLENPKIRSLISDSMDIEGGRIYCSGNKDVVKSVEQSIIHLVMDKDSISEQQAIELLQGSNQLYSSKLYVPG